MKKVLVTFFVAIFATVVLGQGQTKTEIRPTDLPDCVTKYIHEHMVGYTIEKVYRIEKNIVLTYEVTLKKGTERQILTFDADCKHVKKFNPDAKKKTDDGDVKKKTDDTNPQKPAALPNPKK